MKGKSAGSDHALRVWFLNSNGEELQMLTCTLAAPGGRAIWELRLAVNLPAGRYTLDVVDISTGAKSMRALAIR